MSAIAEQNFSDQLKVIGDRQPIFNKSNLFKQINNYSLHMQRIDKHVNDAIDLNERFRQVCFFF